MSDRRPNYILAETAFNIALVILFGVALASLLGAICGILLLLCV
jgi:hypothetical protein